MWIPQTMLTTIQSGADLVIDLDKQVVIPQIMMQLAAAAVLADVKVTFKNCDGKLIPITMVQVAQAGRGHVIFEQ